MIIKDIIKNIIPPLPSFSERVFIKHYNNYNVYICIFLIK